MSSEHEPIPPTEDIRGGHAMQGEHLHGVDPADINHSFWRQQLDTALHLMPEGWHLKLKGWHEGERIEEVIPVVDDHERPGHRKAVIGAVALGILGAAGYKFFQHRGEKLGGHFSPFNPHDK